LLPRSNEFAEFERGVVGEDGDATEVAEAGDRAVAADVGDGVDADVGDVTAADDTDVFTPNDTEGGILLPPTMPLNSIPALNPEPTVEGVV
jgi:hypothetical protein